MDDLIPIGVRWKCSFESNLMCIKRKLLRSKSQVDGRATPPISEEHSSISLKEFSL